MIWIVDWLDLLGLYCFNLRFLLIKLRIVDLFMTQNCTYDFEYWKYVVWILEIVGDLGLREYIVIVCVLEISKHSGLRRLIAKFTAQFQTWNQIISVWFDFSPVRFSFCWYLSWHQFFYFSISIWNWTEQIFSLI